MKISEFFQRYVFGFMCADIERELEWARTEKSAGNFLCALGLLAYTEFMGSLLPEGKRPKDWGARKTFDAFFKEMGPDYIDFLEACNVYYVFRCGLAHEYFVKRDCTIYMLNSPGVMIVKGNEDEPGIAPSMLVLDTPITRPLEAGLGRASNGNYYFVVEKYYEDFRFACESLLVELQSISPDIRLDYDFPWLSDSNAGVDY